MLELITDRTQADVSNGADKGYYNASDLNRVTAAMEELAGVFTDYGYAVSYTDARPGVWVESDIPTKDQLEQYRRNVASIRAVLDVLPTTPETPESMELLDYVKANHIEQILLDVETILEALSKVFVRAGMPWAVAGGPALYFAN